MTASTTRCWSKRLSVALILLLTCLLSIPMAQAAEDIVARRISARVEDGALALSTRFQTTLPPPLQDALQQGVPLSFQLTFELTRPRTTAWWLQMKTLFEPTATLDFKLVYYRLTNRYRVVIGGLASNYGSLNEALSAVGGIAGWRVMDVSDWGPDRQRELRGRVRLELDIGQLPRPFQLNALGSRDWTLASDWITVAPEVAN
ncbi:MAG: DUF4390 domain-containing protein [Vogesella sp.]|uniref:DUF4390 domain-containing protein n=1 Tax=Vogesella sp. TaxID=1904252 RepID=UPI00391B874D